MKLKRLFAASLGALALLAQPGMGADSTDSDKPAQKSENPAKPVFKQEELDQMLAPIALYPDPLLTQVFIAATYPLEVVEAARWQKQNEKLTGEKLTAALEKQTWDPSVKAMVQIPSVLQMLSDKLEWTQKLGDAFLVQQPEVMTTVQKLRKKALDAGNLKDSEQQKIITENAQATQIIRIEQTNPQTVYVPVYNTAWVYGAWGYPGYPPYGYYPMGYYPYYPATGFYYGAAWGLTVGWVASANWNHAEVYVNNNYNRLEVNHNNVNRQGDKVQTLDKNGQRTWQHNPEHRQSVPYADRATQNKYTKQSPSAGTANTRQQDYRGYDSASRGNAASNPVSPAARDQMQERAGSVSPEQRAAAQERAASMSPADRAAAQERLGSSPAYNNVQNNRGNAIPPMSDPYASRPSMDSRPASNNNRVQQQPSGGAFDGMGSGSSARMDSARGASSLGSAGAGARAGGGGARMGGGGMRGGRR